jgi:hypothetical protein
VAGEMLLVTLMPLHPEPSSNNATAQAPEIFQFNFTKRHYKLAGVFGNT